MPGTYNFKAQRGDTVERTFTWKDEDGVAINISGYTVRFQIFGTAIDYSNGNQYLDIDASNGAIEVTIPPTVTDDYEGKFSWSLVVTAPDTTVTTLLVGTVTFVPFPV